MHSHDIFHQVTVGAHKERKIINVDVQRKGPLVINQLRSTVNNRLLFDALYEIEYYNGKSKLDCVFL